MRRWLRALGSALEVFLGGLLVFGLLGGIGWFLQPGWPWPWFTLALALTWAIWTFFDKGLER